MTAQVLVVARLPDFKPVIYRSFAEFFDREFRPGARPFT
jgi:hypothetical protein